MKNEYLLGKGVNYEHQGGSPRVKHFNCTSVGLTFAIMPKRKKKEKNNEKGVS